VHSVGVSPCRNVWMQSLLLLLRSSLNSCVVVLHNLLLAGVSNQCHFLWSLFSSSFCFIIMGQVYALGAHLCFGIAFQHQH
jgi:hypothetical protein